MQSDVGASPEMLRISKQCQRFVTESGEGRKATQESQEEKQPEFGRSELAGVTETTEKSDQKTAYDIHCQRPVWENRAGEQSID